MIHSLQQQYDAVKFAHDFGDLDVETKLTLNDACSTLKVCILEENKERQYEPVKKKLFRDTIILIGVCFGLMVIAFLLLLHYVC